MSRKDAAKVLGAVERMLLAFVFLFAQTAWAGQNQKPKGTADSARAAARQGVAAEKAPSAGGPHEGIKVHGHWTIEVRNPDGTLVTHREFENSLVQGAGNGNAALAALLSRGQTPGVWVVHLQGVPASFFVAENSFSGPSSTNLTVAASGPNGVNLVLSGSVTSPNADMITSVGTGLITCPPSYAPTACPGALATLYPAGLTAATSFQFTGAIVDPSVSVAADQTVAVTVVFSFS